MQDLVGIGVADAAEEMRGSVSARLSVWFSARERARANASSSASSDLEAAADRCAASASAPRTRWSDARLLRARLGERAACRSAKSKRGEADARRRDRAPRGSPAQAAGDHQVEDEEEIVVEREDDALAEPAPADRPACRPSAPTPADRRCAGGTGSRGARRSSGAADDRGAQGARGRARRPAAQAREIDPSARHAHAARRAWPRYISAAIRGWPTKV